MEEHPGAGADCGGQGPKRKISHSMTEKVSEAALQKPIACGHVTVVTYGTVLVKIQGAVGWHPWFLHSHPARRSATLREMRTAVCFVQIALALAATYSIAA